MALSNAAQARQSRRAGSASHPTNTSTTLIHPFFWMLSLRETSSQALCYYTGLCMTRGPHGGMGAEKREEPRPWVEELGMWWRLCRLLRWGIPGGIKHGPQMYQPPEDKAPEDARKDKMDKSHAQASLQELAYAGNEETAQCCQHIPTRAWPYHWPFLPCGRKSWKNMSDGTLGVNVMVDACVCDHCSCTVDGGGGTAGGVASTGRVVA
jgi:hypothetical protein